MTDGEVDTQSRTDDNELPIKGFRVSGHRTLKDVEVLITGRTTVICGPNNAGKSSLLDVIEAVPALLAGLARRPGRTADSSHPVESDALIGVPIELDADRLMTHVESLKKQWGDLRPYYQELRSREGETLWPAWRGPEHDFDDKSMEPVTDCLRALEKKGDNGRGVASQAARSGISASHDGLRKLIGPQPTAPVLKRIVDVRRTAEAPLTGSDLKVFADAASHSTGGGYREKWASTFREVLRDVFDPDLNYEVPNPPSGPEMRLSIDGEEDILLDHVGAGVREVVAIAFQVLAQGGADVILIEEPENCLHPAAAQRLIRSLVNRTDVQLIVTTHSPSIVNAGVDTIVQLTRHGENTTAKVIGEAQARFEAVRALGATPSDLVLAPCALWVEGPSDRTFLAHWLHTHEGLRDGVDYTIAFYGGSLGAHLTYGPDRDAHETYVDMRRLTRRCAILCDSDRSKPRERLKPHVMRWRNDVKADDNAICELTWGREIENYVPLETLNSIRGERGLRPVPSSALRYQRVLGGDLKMAKVDFAERAIEHQDHEIHPEARKLVKLLADFIRAS